MSAESRSLLPDWHQRPVRWTMRSTWRDAEGFERVQFLPLAHDYEGQWEHSHRRSSCLTEYRTDTTASVVIPDPDSFYKE